jgi:hypothetical protein
MRSHTRCVWCYPPRERALDIYVLETIADSE